MSFDVVTAVQMWIAAVAVNSYVLVYLTRPWWTTAAGKALMVKGWGNVILIDLFIAVMVFGDYPGREWIRFAGLTVFDIGVWALLIVLIRTPRRRRDKGDPL